MWMGKGKVKRTCGDLSMDRSGRQGLTFRKGRIVKIRRSYQEQGNQKTVKAMGEEDEKGDKRCRHPTGRIEDTAKYVKEKLHARPDP